MTTENCNKAKLYISREYDIYIAVAVDAGFTMSDIASASATLKLVQNHAVTASFSSAGGSITIGASGITVKVGASDITIAGDYLLIIDLTDTGGAIRGVTPCPQIYTFYSR